MFNVPISLVSLVDSERQWFKSVQGLNVRETPREVSFCGHAILGDDLFVITNTLLDRRFVDNPLVTGEPNIRFYAGSPLKVLNGSRLGTLCIIDQEPREFSDEDKELLKDLTEMAEQELAAVQLSLLDELTLISNRRGLMTLAKHVLNLCNRTNMTAQFVMFDLDGFKRINDHYGHAEGDKALVEFARIMRDIFRDSDIFARIGGDEFGVLMTNISQSEIEIVLERFQLSIDKYNQEAKRGYDIRYSSGEAVYDPKQNRTLEELLDYADKEMYKNKRLKVN
jgi:diguanylate cyclase (GGDEF)-like protein